MKYYNLAGNVNLRYLQSRIYRRIVKYGLSTAIIFQDREGEAKKNNSVAWVIRFKLAASFLFLFFVVSPRAEQNFPSCTYP